MLYNELILIIMLYNELILNSEGTKECKKGTNMKKTLQRVIC